MGQCCVGGADSKSQKEDGDKKHSWENCEVIEDAPANGMLYSDFAHLVMKQYTLGDVLTPNTTQKDQLDAWLYTAQEFDTEKKGYLVWDDIEQKVEDLGREWRQSLIVSDIIETITRSRVMLRQVFIAMDTDGGGRLSKQEFIEGLKYLQGSKLHVDEEEGELLWNLLDVDGDGSISWNEFIQGLSVEDSWGVHASSLDTPVMSYSKLSKKKATLYKITPIMEKSFNAPERSNLNEEAAAKMIQRMYRRNKAIRIMRCQVWQTTLRALDYQDESDLNTVAPSEVSSDEDADEYKEKQSAPTNNNNRDLKALTKDELQTIVSDLLKGRQLPSRQTAALLVRSIIRHLRELPNCVPVSVPPQGQLYIVGDIHGQFDDLRLIIDQGGHPSPTIAYLFNGDFVDRGPGGVECLLLLYALRLLWPTRIFLNRGNHETRRLNEKYGFDEEVACKYDLEMFRLISRSFCTLPIAHVIDDTYFVVHGGLSAEEGVLVEDFQNIDRMRQIPQKDDSRTGKGARFVRIFEGAVWSDPRDIPTWEESKRGAGIHFGSKLVSSFLQLNGFKKLIRSHEAYQPGYAEHHDRQTVTVFSASNYCGTDDNEGCYLVIHSGLEIEYRQYRIAKDVTELRRHVEGHSLPDDYWVRCAEEDVMRRIRMAIFCKRSELLHQFQEFDHEKVGKCHVLDWVAGMQTIVNPHVPWACIRQDLVPMERDGMIAYVPFIERYQNILQARWSRAWVTKMLPYIAGKMQAFVDSLLQESKEGAFSYFEMCDSLRKFLPGLGEAASYHIVIHMDLNRDGFLDVHEFAEAFKDCCVGSKSCLIELWEMLSFDQVSFAVLKRIFQKLANNGDRNMQTNPLLDRKYTT